MNLLAGKIVVERFSGEMVVFFSDTVTRNDCLFEGGNTASTSGKLHLVFSHLEAISGRRSNSIKIFALGGLDRS